jgi:putative lipoprotein (rSAM/lipoprotein system)
MFPLSGILWAERTKTTTMKVFKRKVIKGTNWALAGLMMVLGYSCSKESKISGVDEIIQIEDPNTGEGIAVAYGVPHAVYKLMGTVKDEDGKALEGIRVIIPELNNCTKIFEHNVRKIERNDTLITNEEGAYNFEVGWDANDSLQIKLKVEDPQERFEVVNDSVKYSSSELSDDGEGWVVGTRTKIKEFILKLKK